MTLLHRSSPRRRHYGQRGFSLIELMVSITIAMAMIVAMGVISSRFENSKRQVSSSSDMALNTGYLAYDLDRQLRSAGSGFTTNASATFGCQLLASRASAGGQILPAPAALPAPFASVSASIRMIPLIVHPGIGANSSDVIQVMTGAGGVSEVPTEVRLSSVSTNQFRLTNTVGIKGDDLLLLAEGGQPCMLQQVVAGFTGGSGQQVTLDGDMYASSIGSRSINAYSTGAAATAMGMGNVTNNNPPKFMLLGVNASNQLVSYDLLRFANGDSNSPVPLADGVMDLRVRYGVDTTGAAGVVNAWVKPDTAPYDLATMNANTAAAQAAMAQVLAIRVSLILRSERAEASDAIVSPATLTLFSSLASNLQSTYTVPARNRKYRVLEFTIPLRNQLAVANGRPAPT